jgi:hypothetical protein
VKWDINFKPSAGGRLMYGVKQCFSNGGTRKNLGIILKIEI